ncbi:hypothetical protein GGR21_000758 [Dysgonomonas hofstadii]|uniref:ASCH domain-containing protein n=1 Tax=Dysgonomonas hofstadii TaxID=637886 RepID=A0A840CI36_9BACT|nr:hypothetical protein [Dysgonomonas hofstadii]MBB4034871.1 hypothetical protein [Dysgonomonas hofstadii]
MILGFKPQFVAPILSGNKIHSIREDKTDRWKEGNTIHFATGVRTKNYDNFKMDECKGTQSIKIEYFEGVFFANKVTVFIDGRALEYEEILTLAHNDGFCSVADFLKWFNKDFEGKIIHWTDFKYEKTNHSIFEMASKETRV